MGVGEQGHGRGRQTDGRTERENGEEIRGRRARREGTVAHLHFRRMRSSIAGGGKAPGGGDDVTPRRPRQAAAVAWRELTTRLQSFSGPLVFLMKVSLALPDPFG